ncbi:3-deoxy-D-manno-octulosonic acid kinase [Shewanella sp. NFH-SH190041]|uniref:3-deoxy-D-manno-octulosonic acid kinase n=1 Tax=Shewanella sp. NFH-SH190041 TaxID=2950245 RepID=UPI0021C3325C|nr:3-deoxy-D-manno-octulosonic acid kinase [Shewanella sp. NFH-SH190041]BDM62760.1 3-deoxy-D-manno-octulosonic acid kinase [Shewanella sp. NFH-SH190041]
MPSELKIVSCPSGFLALADTDLQHPTSEWFSAQFWQQNNAIEGTSTGRYTTWFVVHQAQHWVLRHYWRGGLMAKLSKDSYLYTGLHRTRAIAELTLLQKLHQEGFPVPRPIAAHISRHGLWYRGDILIERIAGARDLVAVLSQQTLSAQQWQQLGQCIARFHHRGVYHADLNAKNILLSDDGFHLIDFDRGALRPIAHHWQAANLARLHRSFVKEQGKCPQLAFNEQNWSALLQGYNQPI